MAFACVFALLLPVFAGCGSKDTTKTIAVVAKGESHAFWKSVKSGAEAAGAKYGYRITFRGPTSETADQVPSQKEMVSSALNNKPAALVLATIGTGFGDYLKQAYDEKIPVVHFDSGVWKEDIDAVNEANKNPIKSLVATSNRLAAGLAAEKLFDKIKGDIAATETGKKYVVGIIQHDTTTTGTDRAGGFEERFAALVEADATTKGKCTIIKEIKPGDQNQAYKEALEKLCANSESNGGRPKAIFMCNEGVVKQVYDAIAAAGNTYDDIKFCGYDAGSKQIEWMKKTTGPKLVGSVAQDSFQIGYQSVEQAVFAVEGKPNKAQVDLAGTWWDATNVDDLIKSNIVYEG